MIIDDWLVLIAVAWLAGTVASLVRAALPFPRVRGRR